MADESAMVRLWNRIKGDVPQDDDFGGRLRNAVMMQNAMMAGNSGMMQGGQKFGLSPAEMTPFRNQEEVAPTGGGYGEPFTVPVAGRKGKEDTGIAPSGSGGDTVMTSYGVEIPREAVVGGTKQRAPRGSTTVAKGSSTRRASSPGRNPSYFKNR